jgi:hypothetical protein
MPPHEAFARIECMPLRRLQRLGVVAEGRAFGKHVLSRETLAYSSNHFAFSA